MDLFGNTNYVNHGDELFLMFKPHMMPFESVFTDGDKAVSENLLAIWASFATDGDPNIGKIIFYESFFPRKITPTPFHADAKGRSNIDRWVPISQNDPKHLEIATDGLKLKSDSEGYSNRMKFWEQVYKEFPPTVHYTKSKTFQNNKMYRKIRGAGESGGSKQEL